MDNLELENTEQQEDNDGILNNEAMDVEVEKPKPDKRKAKDNPKRSKQLEQLKLAREKKKQINAAKKAKKREIEMRIEKEMNNELLHIEPIEIKKEPIVVEKKARLPKRKIAQAHKPFEGQEASPEEIDEDEEEDKVIMAS